MKEFTVIDDPVSTRMVFSSSFLKVMPIVGSYDPVRGNHVIVGGLTSSRI